MGGLSEYQLGMPAEVREKTREAFMKINHPKPQLLKTCPPTMKPHSSAHGAGSGWEKMKRNCNWLKGRREGFHPSDIDNKRHYRLKVRKTDV